MTTAKTAPYRPEILIRKIRHCTGYQDRDIPMSYKLFKKIMMGIDDFEPVMICERTVKEKYDLLQTRGFISDTGVLIYEQVAAMEAKE